MGFGRISFDIVHPPFSSESQNRENGLCCDFIIRNLLCGEHGQQPQARSRRLDYRSQTVVSNYYNLRAIRRCYQRYAVKISLVRDLQRHSTYD